MKAPNEIYLHLKNNPLEITFSEVEEKDCINTKYIRADLAELTWEDIRQLFKIADNYESELNRPKYLTQGYCEEIRRRFLEYKAGKK